MTALALPTELLDAVAAGGKITLVVGAGCSFEPPTSIPLASSCSKQCHDRLVADGVIGVTDCATPEDLSLLADVVFAKRGVQKPLVDKLNQLCNFKSATPNDGHLLAAALLREGAITSILTLNFDLAFSIAIAALGVGDTIAIIDGPEALPNQQAHNLFYLHRNANAVDSEAWVLRTVQLQSDWKKGWEAVVTAKVLATPIIVFAGLGSPAAVLIESAQLIQKLIPKANKAFQVDPSDPTKSAFFKALGLPTSEYVQAAWCSFMTALSQRLNKEQLLRLEQAAVALTRREKLHPEILSPVMHHIEGLGLLSLGSMRARWLLHDKDYFPDDAAVRELIADLIIAAAMLARISGTDASPGNDGIIDFRRGGHVMASLIFISGRGSRSILAIEAELTSRTRHFRNRVSPVTAAIVTGTRSTPSPTPPVSVVVGSTTDSIVLAGTTLPVWSVESIRSDPTLVGKIL